MQAGTAPSRRIATSSLLLLMTVLICASCNLSTMPEDASAQFEGPPVIHIAAPQPGQTYLAGTTVIVQARVENAGPDLARVAVLLDEAVLGERLQPNETNAAVLPLTIDWPTSNTGQYTISVVAERADGSAAHEEVSIEVISRQRPEAAPPSDTATNAPQPTTAPSSTPDSPSSPVPTQTTEPAALGPSRVAGTVLAVANLRPGPGVDSGLPLGSLHADSAVMLVAVNPERDWYRVTTGDGGEGWIDARFVEAAETTAGLPVDTGETPAAANGVNLMVTNIDLEPATPVCGQATTIRATVRNSGTLDSQTRPWVSAKAHLISDQSVLAEIAETTYLTQLAAGEETTLEMSITITANYGQAQHILVTVDAGNHILETNENDNIGGSAEFELSQGNCA